MMPLLALAMASSIWSHAAKRANNYWPFFSSYHVNGVTTVDAEQCLQQCQRIPACAWFTFHPDNSFCEMFTGCVNLDTFSCPGSLHS